MRNPLHYSYLTFCGDLFDISRAYLQNYFRAISKFLHRFLMYLDAIPYSNGIWVGRKSSKTYR